MRDFNELVIFTLIAEKMNFTQAADALEISKAAASKAIARLEERLGTRLFERTSRHIRLTEAGEIYWSFARRAMEEADQGESAVSKLSEKPRGTLRVAMPVTLAHYSVAPKLAPFLSLYPELRIQITLKGGQINPITQRVDVAFQTLRPEVDSQTIQRRVATFRLGIYASSRYLSAAPSLRSPQDLTQHSCLTLTETGTGTSWALAKDGRTQTVQLRGRVAIGDPLTHQQLCQNGVGIAVLPEWMNEHLVRKGKLMRVLPDWTPSSVELYVLYPTRLSMTPKLNVFLNFIKEVVPKD